MTDLFDEKTAGFFRSAIGKTISDVSVTGGGKWLRFSYTDGTYHEWHFRMVPDEVAEQIAADAGSRGKEKS